MKFLLKLKTIYFIVWLFTFNFLSNSIYSEFLNLNFTEDKYDLLRNRYNSSYIFFGYRNIDNTYTLGLYKNFFGLGVKFQDNLYAHNYSFYFIQNLDLTDNYTLGYRYKRNYENNKVSPTWDISSSFNYKYVNFNFWLYDITKNISSQIYKEFNINLYISKELSIGIEDRFKDFTKDELLDTIVYKLSLSYYTNVQTEIGIKHKVSTPIENINDFYIKFKYNFYNNLDFQIDAENNKEDIYNNYTLYYNFNHLIHRKNTEKYYLYWELPTNLDLEYGLFKKENPMIRFYKNLNYYIKDKNLKGIIIKISINGNNFATYYNLKRALEKLKKQGKEIIFYLESGSLKDFYLASIGDKIYLYPYGYYIFTYPHFEVMYYKGLMNKLGIDFQFVRYEKFKSAVEPFAFDSSTFESKVNRLEVLYDFRNYLLNYTNLNLDSLVNRPIYTGITLLNRIKKLDKKKFNIDTLNFFSLIKDINRKNYNIINISKIEYTDYQSRYIDGKIAVIPIEGTIITGKSYNSYFEKFTGSDDIIEKINKVEKDKSIKLVVFYINSPGGSALASDIIYTKIKSMKKKKIAYINSLGASGAYYIASACDRIYSTDYSIVGSIGVFYGKFIFKKFYKKLGLNKEIDKLSKYDDFFSENTYLDSTEYKILQDELGLTYKRFLEVVSSSRNFKVDSLRMLAGGRIYTGYKAYKLGLVDSCLDFSSLIEKYSKDLNLKNYEVVFYKKDLKDDLKTLIFSTKVDYYREFIEKMKNPQIYMILPYRVKIE